MRKRRLKAFKEQMKKKFWQMKTLNLKKIKIKTKSLN